VSLVFQQPDESLESSLFERRARAQGAPAAPSLDVVLRAAKAQPCEPAGHLGRTVGGLALAAACVLAVLKTNPSHVARDVSPDRIVADVGAEVPADLESRGGLCEDREVPACALEPRGSRLASLVPPVVPGPACVAPLASFATTGTLACSVDDSVRSELR